MHELLRDQPRLTPSTRTGLRSERGQVVVILAVFLVVLIGAAGLAIDVGSWYRADRATQAGADAAALAGAQALREGTDPAAVLAEEYAAKNGGGSVEISFGKKVRPNDLITVELQRPAAAYFTKVFAIDSVDVNARATAWAGVPSTARYAAPIAVDEDHPMLQCQCFGEETELSLIDLHGPGSGDGAGAFSLIDLDSIYSTGNVGSEELGNWIQEGYDGDLPLGTYRSAPGADFNSGHVKSALNVRLGDELLFPVYRTLVMGGSEAEFEVIAWVGFVPTSFSGGGSRGTIHGYFTQVIWHGIADETGDVPDYGVRVITLVE